MTKKQREERLEYADKLRELFAKHGIRQLFTSVRHVSSTGMSRVIAVYAFTASGDPRRPIDKHWLSWWVATALGWRFDEKYEGIKVDGAGMNMCFHTIYTLGQVLYSHLPRDQWPVWAEEGRDAGYLFDKEDL